MPPAARPDCDPSKIGSRPALPSPPALADDGEGRPGVGVGAEALSGLARAFFYAGARALLVSHWRVDSDAAVRLTTTTFAALQKNPAIGRAEALRRAMLATIDDTANPWNAYPDTWAPFSVIGEGGR